MLAIEKDTGDTIDIVVMIQGDEPMVTPAMIDKSLEPFKDQEVNVVNLMADIMSNEGFEDPNEVKVVVDNNSNAIYFSFLTWDCVALISCWWYYRVCNNRINLTSKHIIPL